MQYAAIIVFVWFMIKSLSFSIYEIKVNKNKFGGALCVILTIASFIAALVSLVMLYGQSFIGDTHVV